MSSTYTLRLNDFDSEMLNSIAKRTDRSKADLIMEGLRNVFASRLDQQIRLFVHSCGGRAISSN